ncbi:hypothetical protein N0V83_003885 [Neocucurbitaria cava]|uniref:Yeast cell wall synthesis Kre9/Knh1-like N-terminal domain-containing protein n=1 Tax=Neocucurbitaria cava TaxID=798079 RepID=A0A9W9CMS3_9PLEO|nr:hypothetical protein N0V83_003885 [Neocucurbitaria cava]
MRFFETVISGAALIAAVFALEINDFPSSGVVAGQTYTVTYSPKDDTPTTFILRQGDSGNLKTVQTLTTTATGGSFSWTVPKDLTDESDYALEIQQGEVINYSAQFPLSGGSGSDAASSAISSAYASASSAAASAASSASAALSSAISSAVASATISPSAGTNTTVTSATLSRTATGTKATASATSSGSVPESTGAASSLATSPLAALFGAVAAFAYLA